MRTILLMLITFLPTAVMAENYLCITDYATGFHFNSNSKEWEITDFNTKNGKYLVLPSENIGATYIVKSFADENAVTSECKDEFNEYGYINCIGENGNFLINKFSNRFVRTYPFGYTDVGIGVQGETTEETSFTPSISIGKCAPF